MHGRLKRDCWNDHIDFKQEEAERDETTSTACSRGYSKEPVKNNFGIWKLALEIVEQEQTEETERNRSVISISSVGSVLVGAWKDLP